jgi:hypothetical protein
MKKKRMKIIKLLVLPIVLIISSCNTEEMYLKDKRTGNKNGIVSKYLIGQEAKKVADILRNELRDNGNINLSSTKANSTHMRLGQMQIDYNNILLVLDTIGVKNYTFKIINHPDDSEAIFHNLVLNEDEYNNRKLLMLKYEKVNQSLPFNQFQGTINKQGISDETNPCDNGTYDANFDTGLIVPGNGGAVGTLPPSGGSIPPSGNPPNDSGSGGDGSGSVPHLTLYFICNSDGCSFSASSWSVFSTHRDEKGNVWAFTIIVGRSSSAPNTLTDPCGNDGSIGVIDTKDKETPCQKLNKFITNNTIQQTLRILKEQSSGSEEHGNYITQETNPAGASYSSFPLIPPNPDKPNILDISAGIANGNVKGALHCHTDPVSTGGVPMFSPADLRSLYKIAINYNNNGVQKNYAEYTVMLSVGSGHYAIKFKDFNDFYINYRANFDKFDKSLNQKYKVSTATATSDTLIKNFLNALKDNNFGSIGLYKATETTTDGVSSITGWKEQTLDNNGDISETPCN